MSERETRNDDRRAEHAVIFFVSLQMGMGT